MFNFRINGRYIDDGPNNSNFKRLSLPFARHKNHDLRATLTANKSYRLVYSHSGSRRITYFKNFISSFDSRAFRRGAFEWRDDGQNIILNTYLHSNPFKISADFRFKYLHALRWEKNSIRILK